MTAGGKLKSPYKDNRYQECMYYGRESGSGWGTIMRLKKSGRKEGEREGKETRSGLVKRNDWSHDIT